MLCLLPKRNYIAETLRFAYDHLFKPNENRRRKIKSANSHDFQIRETNNMEPFWNEVLIPNLQISHGGIPVHSLQEIQYLKDTFPEHVKQYDIYEGDKILGGTTLFNTKKHLWRSIFLQPLMGNLQMHFLHYLLILLKKNAIHLTILVLVTPMRTMAECLIKH